MINKKLSTIVGKIDKVCNPVSVFLYGSRARNDYIARSDYEIGVLMKKDNYVSRSKINKNIRDKQYMIFPFEYENFMKGKIDTPFQEALYLRELLL